MITAPTPLCHISRKKKKGHIKYWSNKMILHSLFGGRNCNHSSILAWTIQWTEEPGGLQSRGSQKVRHNWTHTRTHTHTHIEFPVSEMIYTYVGVLENKDYTNYSKGLTILVQLILEDLAKWATYNSAANWGSHL